MKATREQVVVLVALCMGVNFFSVGSYLLGYYRNIASSGVFYDIILGAESGLDLASDIMLFSVLRVPANPALSGPTPAQVVETLRKFIMVNAGTIVVCCVGHLAGNEFISRHIRVEGVHSAGEEQSHRDRAFLEPSLFYIVVAIVKGVILYLIYTFYEDCKTNPPTQGVIFVMNPFTKYPAAAVVPAAPTAPPQVPVAPHASRLP